MSAIRSEPCAACPYRRDVPSGLWAAHEYEKLMEYDAITPMQPMAVFVCHASVDNPPLRGQAGLGSAGRGAPGSGLERHGAAWEGEGAKASSPNILCAGWAWVHSNRGNPYALLALRIWPPDNEITEPRTPLFSSGTEAAEHGMREIDQPTDKAKEFVDRLLHKHPRLRVSDGVSQDD